MTFDEILVQVLELLQREGRLSYLALKLRFNLDDRYLEALKAELIKAKRLAVDEDGEVLVWAGKTGEREAKSVEGGKAEPREPNVAPRSTLRAQRSDGERRQLTVMFIDVVGSTTLSQQLDPEDYHGRVVAYQAACRQVIQRYEGHIAQYLGDGVLAYFGYPTAHEEDAARAVRSGLEIVAAVGQLKYTPPLQVRVGIHTGPVVVGEIGAEEHTERLAVGETPNLAARVQGIAEPDTVVLSALTHRLIAGLFECQDLGPQTLKGSSTPLALYRVSGESAAQSRFEVALRAGLTPFIGREHEVELLQERWERAKQGSGQVVLLSGEPGIGKSRLVQEFKERFAHEGATRIEFRCSPYHQNSAFYPIIEHLQRLLQFVREDVPAVKLEKLQHTLRRYHFPQADTLPLLAVLLSLPHPEGSPPITVSPQKQKEQTQAALVAWLVEEAQKAAVFCVWEDMHWADPSTLEVLTLLPDQVPTTRLLALLTFRPEFVPPWGNRSHLSQMTLSRLGRTQVEAMVEQVTGSTALPPEVVQQIVSKTDGVPLFVEELTKMVVEAEADVGARRAVPLPLGIPSTLQDALMARLDRLGPTKEIAQLGATIGREFSYELLHTVSPLDEERLQQGLKQLVEAELVYQRGLPPQAHYLFKHALIQDTAYQSLLKSTRQQYHHQIAQVLADRFPETVKTQPELVAHHYTEAGRAEPAMTYWLRAGQQAAQRAANLEAIQYFHQVLALLEALPQDRARDTTELKVLTHLGPALMVIKGWAAPEVGTAYKRANELASRLESSADLVPPLVGIWLFHNARGRYDLADAVTEQLFHVARSTSDEDVLLQAHHAGWPILLFRGAFASASAHIEQGLHLYDYERHKRHALLYMGHDPAVCAHACGAQAAWALGLPDRAARHGMQAIELARRVVHTPTLAFALWYISAAHAARDDAEAVLAVMEELLPLSQEQKLVQNEASALLLGGWALAATGSVKDGLKRMRVGFGIWNATGNRTWLPVFTCLYGDGLLRDRRYPEALEALDHALELGRQTGERRWESRIHHLRGEALLHSGEADAAVESLQTAMQVARAQQARSWELRAATRLARLWAEQGERDDARDLLAPVYSWFTEGFDTKDLQEAKALLEELT